MSDKVVLGKAESIALLSASNMLAVYACGFSSRHPIHKEVADIQESLRTIRRVVFGK